MKHLHLGASLYVPATRPDLAAIAAGDRFGHLRSVIFCTEDGIDPRHIGQALQNLRELLVCMRPAPGLLRFVRVRDAGVMAEIVAMPGAEKLDGYVVPKATRSTLASSLATLPEDTQQYVMPVLETAEVFDADEMRLMRTYLLQPDVRRLVLTLRIGGNDLFRLLGVRRSVERTIYETVLGPVISSLVTTFRPWGIPLCAPVFEGLAQPEVLRREVEADLMHGLFGKTAVHPNQIGLIHDLYAVSHNDVEMATRLSEDDAPAVFAMHGTMCERAVHLEWARATLIRASLFGSRGQHDFVAPASLQ
jgi:citrate lyase beta subunit